MKANILFFLCLIFPPAALLAQGQGTFQNLNFESAVIVPIPNNPGFVEFAQAFPGWTGYLGNQQVTVALNNDFFLSSLASLSIWGPDSPTPNYLQGHFMLMLQAGLISQPSGPFVTAAIQQTGQIPGSAQSLQFLSTANLQTSQLSVFFGGQALNLTSLASGPNSSTLYGADISGFAGATGVLRFQSNSGNPFFDAIQFSNQPIPEPSALGLFGLGALLLGWRLRRTLGM